MKTLILTSSTGGGHNSCASAIKDYFEKNGRSCDIVNFLNFTNKAKEQILSKGHIFLYRHMPRLFGAGYKQQENSSNWLIYQQSAETADRLYEYLKENGYTQVICVHTFAALAMTEIRKRYSPDIKQYFVATDYTCSPSVDDQNMDGYFVPFGCKDEFVEKGLPAEKIFETGIPIAPKFYEHGDKSLAREELALCKDGPLAVLMCGSMGAGPMLRLTSKLSEKLPSDATLVVVCGSNKLLYNQLSAKALRCVKAVGFTDKMSTYLDAADLLISKPGGLSSTESFFKHIPLLCIDLVYGCETRNLEFFKKEGCCFWADDIDGLADRAAFLLTHQDELNKMRAKLERTFSYNASENIYNCIC